MIHGWIPIRIAKSHSQSRITNHESRIMNVTITHPMKHTAALRALLLGSGLAAAVACGSPQPASEPAAKDTGKPPVSAAAPSGGYAVYVTNETSGNLTVIDGATHAVRTTIPLGKRPRGVRAAADGNRLFIALSGSPLAPPGVDESKLPPPDRTADGIGVVDLATGKLTTVLKAGS